MRPLRQWLHVAVSLAATVSFLVLLAAPVQGANSNASCPTNALLVPVPFATDTSRIEQVKPVHVPAGNYVILDIHTDRNTMSAMALCQSKQKEVPNALWVMFTVAAGVGALALVYSILRHPEPISYL